MKTKEDLSASHMRNVVAEQAHNAEVERMKEMYEEVQEYDFGLVVTSMNDPLPRGIFKEVKKND